LVPGRAGAGRSCGTAPGRRAGIQGPSWVSTAHAPQVPQEITARSHAPDSRPI
jgi:hypothetical protein